LDLVTGAAQARGIHQVALILKLFQNEVIAEQNLDSLSDKEKNGFVGLFFSFIVLRALAAELALKVLYSQQTGSDAVHSHDLSILFQALPRKTRDSISQRFQNMGRGKTIEDVFDAHKDDFIAWRYVYQDPHQHTGIGDLEAAIEATLEEFGA